MTSKPNMVYKHYVKFNFVIMEPEVQELFLAHGRRDALFIENYWSLDTRMVSTCMSQTHHIVFYESFSFESLFYDYITYGRE